MVSSMVILVSLLNRLDVLLLLEFMMVIRIISVVIFIVVNSRFFFGILFLFILL